MDPNLKLAIISQLITNGLFSFDKEAFFIDKFKRKWDPNASYNNEPNEEIKNYFLSIELNKFDLKQITNFSFICGEPTTIAIWPFWDGEDDYFHIRSLQGIEICPNIKTFEIDMYSYITDFTPLTKLKHLEEVSIEYNWEPEPIKTLEPFLEIKTLKKLSLINVVLSGINLDDDIILKLKQNGVETNIVLYP